MACGEPRSQSIGSGRMRGAGGSPAWPCRRAACTTMALKQLLNAWVLGPFFAGFLFPFVRALRMQAIEQVEEFPGRFHGHFLLADFNREHAPRSTVDPK